MQKIIFPLQFNDKGAEIKNLHEAILALGPKMNIPGFLDLFNTPEFMSTIVQERKEEVFGQATRQLISAFQVIYMKVAPSGMVDEDTANVMNGLLEKYGLIPPPPAPVVINTIQGRVFDKWIEPLPNATVKAFVQDIRSEQMLGEAVTDRQGKYTIQYTPGKAVGPGATTVGGTDAADLILRLYGNDGCLLYTSPVYYDAPPQLQADIDLGPFAYRGDPEFTAAVKKISPYLGKLTIDELNETADVHDLSYLISKTGIAVDVLLTLVAAYRFANWAGVKAPVFYGLLRELGSLDDIDGQGAELPDNLDASLQQVYVNFWSNPVATMMAAFQQAVDDNKIPYKLWAHQAEVQANLQRLKQAPPALPGGTVELPVIYKKINLAGLNADQGLAVLENYQAGVVDDDFWAGLSQDPSFQGTAGTATLNKLQAVLQLSDWTADNTGLAAYILEQHKIAGPNDFRQLVSYDTSDWVNIINTSGTLPTAGPNGEATDVETIAFTLAAGIEAMYPTPVFAARFAKATNLPITNQDYMTTVLQAEDFDIQKTSIPSYLNTHVQKNPLPEGADQQTIAYKMMGLQRVYKTVKSADTSLALLSANIQSARQIYAMGKTSFVNQYQQSLGGSDNASAIFEQAATVHAGAAYLTGKLVSTLNNPATNLLPNYTDQIKGSKLASDHPNLAKLFGIGASYCECKDCHSFLGLPAYLTDLLDFLYERKIPGGGSPNNARAVLLANSYTSHGNHWRRRPDLGDIDLTCYNTNTELPYIDVVNELLEDYIIPPIAAIQLRLNDTDPKGLYNKFIIWVLVLLKPGRIQQRLYNLLMKIGQDPRTPICNISLLTPEAIVSKVFFSDNENFPSWIYEQWIPQWIIRDRYITLKVALAVKPRTIDLLPSIFGKDLIILDIEDGLTMPADGPGILGNIYNNDTFVGTTGDGRVEAASFALIVQEIHETHLSNAEITTNPEYTNTNVYNSLSDPFNTSGHNKWQLYPDRIALNLPFDLYFTEANTYLEKMGKKRWDLFNTYRKQTVYPASAGPVLEGNSRSIESIANAYLGISMGDEAIIFTAMPGQQEKFWGNVIASTGQPEVDLFLVASGLSFQQLQTLLTLKFINPTGDSYIADLVNGSQPVLRGNRVDVYDTCNTAAMVITAMTKEKLDRINRFLRLWNKVQVVTSFSMRELDNCILSAALGNNVLDHTFSVSLYYFLRVMELLSLNATQALVLYQDMASQGNNSLYHQLFQNRQISNPLVAAFHLPLPTGSQVTKITDTQANPGAIPVILTACGLTQEDLTVIMNLDNGAYSELSITNLSFIYACGLLCNALSCSTNDVFTLTGLLGFNPLRLILSAKPAARPESTFHFITKYQDLQNAGLTVDDLNYLLTNQSNALPSLIPDTTTIIAGLEDLRSGVQDAVAATTPAPDPKGTLLQKWLADPSLGWNKNISTKLLSILSSIAGGNYIAQVQENLRFLQLLQTQYPVASASTYLDRLPAISFPDSTIAGIQFDNSHYFLFYYGTMSDGLRQFLIGIAPDAASQAAVQSLYTQSQTCPISAVQLPGASPSAPPAWVSQGQQNIPAFSGGTGALGFVGVMSPAVYGSLLGQSTDPGYGAALGQLFLASQFTTAATTTYVLLSSLPPIALPDKNAASLAYDGTTHTLSFGGTMSAADLRCLLGLSTDTDFQSAIGKLYAQSQGSQTASTPLASLPAGWSQLPDISTLPGLTAASGTLTFNGQMNPAVQSALLNLSFDGQWATAINTLYINSQSALVSSVAGSLPSIVLPLPDTNLSTVTYEAGAIVFTGSPNAECMDEFNLQQLGTDEEYSNAIAFIYSGVSPSGCTGITLSSLPPISFPAGINISRTGGQLLYTGQMPASELHTLQGLSQDAAYQAALNELFTNSRPDTVCSVSLAALPSIDIPSGLDFFFDPTTSVLYYQGSLPIPAATITTLRALSSAIDYQAALDTLSAATVNPGPFMIYAPAPQALFSSVTLASGSVQYQGGRLGCTTPMSFEDCLGLLSLSADPAYQRAVMEVYISALSPSSPNPVLSSSQISLPSITFPALYSSQLSWSPAKSELTLNGFISAADQAALMALGKSYTYQEAIGALYSAVQLGGMGGGHSFPGLYETMLPLQSGALTVPAATDLYGYFLQSISLVYRPVKEAEALATKISGNFGVSAAVAAVLVGGLPDLFASMTDPVFAANSKAINPDPLQSGQALWYMKLARMGFLTGLYNISAADTEWLLQHAIEFKVLALDAYPSLSSPLPFTDWQVFNWLRIFQQHYAPVKMDDAANPGQDISISVYSIITDAKAIATDISSLPPIPPNPGDLLDKLIRLTGWDRVELLYLLHIDQVSQPGLLENPLQLKDSGVAALGCITDLSHISILQRLSDCYTIASQLKVVPSRCVVWVTDPITDTVAIDIKQALKSLYPDETSWTSAVVPLMNTLRQHRRDAVLSYLLSNSVKNPFSFGNPGNKFSVFPDEFAVYGNFLIDTEMAACQPTTRIIQGYCSIQLFVQRCLMNSEAPLIEVNTDAVTGDPDWLQWDWMGTAESWYEARYTFLFPENLILPQTLPGQSSFFQDMQNDLTQGPVTMDIVTTAYSNYLESLDEVARLQVKGTWYDEPSVTLYVFARTYGGTTATYYFRTLKAGGRWSAWEEVAADISGDTIIPLVQNGRLYLYWPIFTSATDEDKKTQTQKAQGNSKGDISASSPPPAKYWQIQMAFSEYRNGKWSGKKLSTDTLSCQMLSTSGSHHPPFPDTKDFVFFGLDIPSADSNAYEGTVAAMETNNTMAIACFLKAEVTVLITITFYPDFPFVSAFKRAFSLTVELQNLQFSNKELLKKVNTAFAEDDVTVDLHDYITLDLLSRDLSTTIEDNLNKGLESIYWRAEVGAISFSSADSNSLTTLKEGTDNAYLLDPARGYPTAINLSNIVHYDSQINRLWFAGSEFDSMLLEGNIPLEDNKGHNILSSPLSLKYGNVLCLQMGLWAKYRYLKGNQLNLKYLGNLMPFFYQDKGRTFFVNQAMTLSGKKLDYPAAARKFLAINGNQTQLNQFLNASSGLTMDNGPEYQFINFYHPFAHYFFKILVQEDLVSILSRPIQLTGDDQYKNKTEVKQNLIHAAGYKNFSFKDHYSPTSKVKDIDQSGIDNGYPLEQLDFDLTSSYGLYNWEFFFHGVLLSSMQLTQNQQFEDADNFIKSILNLTDGSRYKAPQKFWVTKPFFENTDTGLSLDEQVLLYELDPSSQKKFWESVKLWRNDPYDPHLLAQMRITPYMYTTFMKWMDNRLAWADYNYTQYTMESVNIAIQLYMSVLEALGPKPQAIPPVAEVPVCNYYQVELNLEILMNAEGPNGYLSDPIVMAENLLPPAPSGPGSSPGSGKKLQMVPGLYFCIPPNEVLLSYWDKVETQLNKIRNCMNIKGQFQPLSPFPNIPGMYGADGSGVGDFGGILPSRRFVVLVQKATELCNEVKGLGTSLLAALEKQDAENLALLHSTQDIALQKAVDKVKQLQINDAELSLQNLQNYQTILNDKVAYYSGLVQNGGLIALERQELSLAQVSLSLQGPIQAGTQIAAGLKQIPNTNIGINGTFGSPSCTITVGGVTAGAAADSAVSFLSFLSLFAGKSGELAKTNATYTRRLAEWNFQLTLANDELTQVNTQIQAAQNKIAIANQEEQNQQLIIENAENVDSFLRNKYTNRQLYSWMVSQLSGIYFQSYQLAYNMAKQAEVCFGYELGITGSTYINYGYWDSLHKGLLSGEGLMASLKQMESDYLNLDVREYELTRPISLAQLDPVALLQLKTRKSCYINIPEELFDLDYPGHYFRRIKHVSITLPGVVGPYTPVCLKMTLLNNSVRIDPSPGTANNYPRNRNASGAPTNDKRFLDNVAAIQYIATSTGVNDNGLFEVNLHDERYLPFERAGAISTWQLELPSVYSQFDLESITDLILQFSYTARDGGPALQSVASESLQKKLAGVLSAPDLVLMRSFSAKRDFPTQWYKFLNPLNAVDPQELDLDISRRLPFITQDHTVRISGVAVLADIPAGAAGGLAPLYLTGPKVKDQLIDFGTDARFGTMLYSMMSCRDVPGVWKVKTSPGGAVVTAGDVEDLVVVFYYSMGK
ncbi:MAG TPA: neuraminidase-like domain-containing protein [Puia sp.]|nr:neuraminidase-like domain-containing protein [Puia sp.]